MNTIKSSSQRMIGLNCSQCFP